MDKYFAKDKTYNIICSVNFGMEAVVKKELWNLGIENLKVQDRRIEFQGSIRDLVRCNLWLRSCERVFVNLAEFPAHSFDELYEKTKALDWEKLLPVDAEFPVQGRTYKSKLFSISDSQSIVKKAIVDSLTQAYGIKEFPETGPRFKLEVEMNNDIATLTLDSSGRGLHRRGYRDRAGDAPLKETMAAALIQLSIWNPDMILVDPFCGSGTIPIEAAMIGRNIAPGLDRDFDLIYWDEGLKEVYREERVLAMESIDYDTDLKIYGSDLDKWGIDRARSNADNAGVLDDIDFKIMDARNLKLKDDYGVIITNPPYGERMGTDKEIFDLYRDLSKVIQPYKKYSSYFLTSFRDFEKAYGKKASKRRKFYNGKLRTDYYQYFGPRPKR